MTGLLTTVLDTCGLFYDSYNPAVLLKRLYSRVELNLKLQLISLRELTSSLGCENGLGGVVNRTMAVLRMVWRIKIVQSFCFARRVLLFRRTRCVDLKVPAV